MSGDATGPRTPSPASALIRAWVAVAFVAVWLVTEVADFFFTPDDTLPLWWDGAGLLVLGYLLGISLEGVLAGVVKR